LGVTAVPAVAGTSALTGYVKSVMVTDSDLMGGCAAYLADSKGRTILPKTKLPACTSAYLTFRCKTQDGDTREHDPVLAYRMLDQAQLAYAAGKQVTVNFRDDPAYNTTVCTIDRILLR
jgi:hypothetical protein